MMLADVRIRVGQNQSLKSCKYTKQSGLLVKILTLPWIYIEGWEGESRLVLLSRGGPRGEFHKGYKACLKTDGEKCPSVLVRLWWR